MVNVAAFVDDRDDLPAHGPWLDAFADELRGDDERRLRELPRRRGSGPGPRGLPGRDLGSAGAIKRRYDPENLFHRNQNVPPA